MNNIYLPDTNYACIVVRDKDTIRAYHQQPTYNTTLTYTDYYINSHYLQNIGSTTYGQYSTLPTCLDTNIFTTDIFYRNDIVEILFIFLIFVYVCIYWPIRIFMRLFHKKL